ncbi:MAG: crossover junction endodeoxyribonuclease RuvC [Desulfamplus sp.]|nr:crossover junction endodeoxyribonuclease RuvC [Desulfamplus sp.]
MIKVIGIDPGLAGTGIGVVQGESRKISAYSFGSINTDKKDSLHLRLNLIYTQTIDFLHEQSPDIVIFEDIFSLKQYPNSAITLGKVTGVLMLAAYKSGATIYEIPVKEAKKLISGSGNADKYQVEESVRHILKHPQEIRPFHSSDALALAIAGLFRYSSQLYCYQKDSST